MRHAFTRWGAVLTGTLLIGVGLITLPVPLFPSFAALLAGCALIARSSARFGNWLTGRAWFKATLARVRNPRLRAWLVRALVIDRGE